MAGAIPNAPTVPSAAYQEGRAAYWADRWLNPYRPGSSEATAWDAGLDGARRDFWRCNHRQTTANKETSNAMES